MMNSSIGLMGLLVLAGVIGCAIVMIFLGRRDVAGTEEAVDADGHVEDDLPR